MKKEYLKPGIKVLGAIAEDLLSGSVTGDPNGGIGYGGVDTGGNKDPEAKQYIPDEFQSVWSD